MNPSSTYYIMINGKPLGPIPVDKIRQQLISGILLPGTQISADGFLWKPIEMLFGNAIASGQSTNAIGLPPTALVPYRFGLGHEQTRGVNYQNTMVPTGGHFHSDATPKSIGSGTKTALLLTGIAGIIAVLILAFLIIAGAGERGKPDWPAIIEKTSRSVAFIEIDGGRGSGFLVSKGLIATNAHVVGDNEAVRLTFPKAEPRNRASYMGFVVFSDKKRDLAIIESDIDIPFLELGESKKLKSGEDVSILGFPALNDGIAPFSSARGTFSQIILFPHIPDVEWADMALSANHGNSGGPVINGSGQVVGIATRLHIHEGLNKWVEGHVACVVAEEVALVIDFIKKKKGK